MTSILIFIFFIKYVIIFYLIFYQLFISMILFHFLNLRLKILQVGEHLYLIEMQPKNLNTQVFIFF
jgi:hypothetical protein